MQLKPIFRMRTHLRILVLLVIMPLFFPLSCSLYQNITGEIDIENNTQYKVTEFYVALEDAEDWGENMLDTPIEPGETGLISGLPRKKIKVKSVFSDGHVNIREDQDLHLYYKIKLVFI